MVSPDLWLGVLTKMSKESQESETTCRVNGSLIASAFISGVIRVCLLFYGLLRSARKLLLHAPVFFSDTNPAGSEKYHLPTPWKNTQFQVLQRYWLAPG